MKSKRNSLINPFGRGVRRVAGVMLSVLAAWAHAGDGEEKPRAAEDPRDDDLQRRLVRQAGGGDEDVMVDIIAWMDEAAGRLEIEFDAGEGTQALQQRIVDRLDHAILQAAQQRTRQQDQPPTSGDKRRKPPDARRPDQGAAEGRTGETDTQTSGTTEAGAESTATGAAEGELGESRRSWGHLPQREREEILQGFGEDFLERYRDWIEQYYRTLQETDE